MKRIMKRRFHRVRNNYAQSAVPTYFGEAQAVVRAGQPGVVRITAEDGERTAIAEITCKE